MFGIRRDYMSENTVMEQTTVSIPAILNLFDVVSARPYFSSPENNEQFQKNKKRKKTAGFIWKLIFFPAVAVCFVYLHRTGQKSSMWIAGIIAFIIYCIGMSVASSIDRKSQDDISKKIEEADKKIIDELMRTTLPESRYIYAWNHALIYNNDIFAYVSITEGLLVIYRNGNLKELSYKEVDGSHDYGDLYDISMPGSGVATVKYKGKGYKKEIRIEVCTNYMAYPIFTFNVPATPQFYEGLKIAGSILC